MLAKMLINGEQVTFDDALEMARREETPIPYPFMKAIIEGIRTRQATAHDSQVSATDVIGCPRAKYIKSTEDYAEDPENLFPAFRGQLLHQLLARYSEAEALVETRTSRDFGGHTLYGTADSIITTRANGRYKLRDFKTTKRIPQYTPWTNHTQQINIYRWLYELPVGETDMSVIYFDLNGAEIAERKLKEKRIWSDATVEEFLKGRFLPLAKALAEKRLPLFKSVPSDITSWMCAYCPVFGRCYEELLKEEGGPSTYLLAARGRS